MTQVSLKRQKIPNWFRRFSLARIMGEIPVSLSQKQLRYLTPRVMMGFSVVVMSAWNWKLVLATGTGVSLMLLVYLVPGWNWRRYWSNCQQFFKGSSGKFTLAVGSGGFAALSTYIAASIWADSENRWLATGILLQGLGTVLTLGLLIWHIITDRYRHSESQLEQWLTDLTDSDPLKRLIAIRQLAHLVNQGQVNQTYQSQIVDYFRLLLIQEQETLIIETVLDVLAEWYKQPLRLNHPQHQPLSLRHSQPLKQEVFEENMG